MGKKIFITLSLSLVLIIGGWILFINHSQGQRLAEVNLQLKIISTKVWNARKAKSSLDLMKTKYEEEQKNLIKEQTRFINKNNLSLVAEKLQIFAKKNNLKLMDFAPLLDSYFSEPKQKKIVTLPINIGINGRYLDIGRFLENLPTLPFYLVADEILLKRVSPKQNILRAEIKAKLYAWNE